MASIVCGLSNSSWKSSGRPAGGCGWSLFRSNVMPIFIDHALRSPPSAVRCAGGERTAESGERVPSRSAAVGQHIERKESGFLLVLGATAVGFTTTAVLVFAVV